jgi:hypothetical protein
VTAENIMMKRNVFLFAVFFLIGAPKAFPQGISLKNLELSLSAGRSSFSSKDFQIGSPQSSTPIDGTMKIKGGTRGEGRLNFLTSNRFGSEAFYIYEKNSVEFNRSGASEDTLSIPLQVHLFGVNVLYYPTGTTESKWRPFVSVGGGAMIYRPTGRGQDIATDPLRGNLPSFIESSRAAVTIGAGLKRSLGRSFGVRFDVGDVLTGVPTFGLPHDSTDPNASVLPISGRMNNFHASVGITLFLGR